MKRMKRLASLMLAMVMVLAMTMTAFAVGEDDDQQPAAATYKITINNSLAGHTYEAYQIFAGTLYTPAGSEDKILSDITWGSGVSAAGQTALGDAKAKAEALEKGGEAAAKEFAQTVSGYLTTASGTTSTSTDGKYVIEGLAPGYYLIKDKDGSLSATGEDNYTTFILEVVGDAVANPKNTGTPEPDKKVKDKNDSTGDTSDWQASADYDIGDEIDFQLKATLPATIDAYDKYVLEFEDTLSAGLSYKADSVKVYLQKSGQTTPTELSASAYTLVEPTGAGGKLEIKFADVKAAPVSAGNGDVIIVEYKATLNEGAVIGMPGNENTLVLKFSNNPNSTGDGENEPTGTTPPKIAVVFTFKTVVNKVQPDGEGTKPLAGAAFSLQKFVTNANGTTEWKEVKSFTAGSETSFSFDGLDDGRYKLTETTTPDGFNTISDIYFKIEAVHDTTVPEGKDKAEITNLTVTETDADGNAFTGGNKPEFEVVFTPISDANHANSGVSTDILNQKGSTLPSTGGIGTTIFYVVGGILVLGAGILLVVKRRMNAR